MIISQYGREEIYTDYEVVDESNIIDILVKAMPIHEQNAIACKSLLEFEKGKQPIERIKEFRPEIDVECCDNIANEVTTFNLGYRWSNPVTLVQNAEKDQKITDAIEILDKCYDLEGVTAKNQQLGRFVEICGIGYTYIDVNWNYTEGESYFKYEVLNPLTTFVIRSNYYVDRRVMCAVSYRIDENGFKYFTCFTKDKVITVDYVEIMKVSRIKRNEIGMIPITEYILGYDRMGCFERQISELDNLNLLISDLSNQVEQNTQAIWHANDIDLGDDGENVTVSTTPESNSWIYTFTSPDGRQPFIKPLSIDYDYDGVLQNITTRRALILKKCGVPQRNDNSGGSTGLAMDMASGWAEAENMACKVQAIVEASKMNEVKIVLGVIRTSPKVETDSPIKLLKITDIRPNTKRNKSFDLTVKINAFATAVSHGIYGLHALKLMNAFEDVNEVWQDSKELIEAYQSKAFINDESDSEPLQDLSDQITNSPYLGGGK